MPWEEIYVQNLLKRSHDRSHLRRLLKLVEKNKVEWREDVASWNLDNVDIDALERAIQTEGIHKAFVAVASVAGKIMASLRTLNTSNFHVGKPILDTCGTGPVPSFFDGTSFVNELLYQIKETKVDMKTFLYPFIVDKGPSHETDILHVTILDVTYIKRKKMIIVAYLDPTAQGDFNDCTAQKIAAKLLKHSEALRTKYYVMYAKHSVCMRGHQPLPTCTWVSFFYCYFRKKYTPSQICVSFVKNYFDCLIPVIWRALKVLKKNKGEELNMDDEPKLAIMEQTMKDTPPNFDMYVYKMDQTELSDRMQDFLTKKLSSRNIEFEITSDRAFNLDHGREKPEEFNVIKFARPGCSVS